VADVDRVAVGAVAVALLGHDHHAPLAVEVAGRLHRRRGGDDAETENGRKGGLTEGGGRNHWKQLPWIGRAATVSMEGESSVSPVRPVDGMSVGMAERFMVTYGKVACRFRDIDGERWIGSIRV